MSTTAVSPLDEVSVSGARDGVTGREGGGGESRRCREEALGAVTETSRVLEEKVALPSLSLEDGRIELVEMTDVSRVRRCIISDERC